jgi:hypothetical protein
MEGHEAGRVGGDRMKTDMNCTTCGARLMDISRTSGCNTGHCAMVRRLWDCYP